MAYKLPAYRGHLNYLTFQSAEQSKPVSGIIARGAEQGVFRQDINVEATVTALMAQIKGIGYHATLGKRKRDEVDQAITEIER